MRVRAAGSGALLIETDVPLALALWLRRFTVVDVIPAAATVMVTATPSELAAVRAALPEFDDAAATPPAGELVEIIVDYDGPDLDDVARLWNCEPEDVIARHSASAWTVAFCGFAPGFAYLTRDDAIPVPRRTSPRTSVPAGSVGLAGEYSGVYPRSSPGGWQLIGRTTATLWNSRSSMPSLLAPGMRVRFTPR